MKSRKNHARIRYDLPRRLFQFRLYRVFGKTRYKQIIRLNSIIARVSKSGLATVRMINLCAKVFNDDISPLLSMLT